MSIPATQSERIALNAGQQPASPWSQRYQRHRFVRVPLPAGIPPLKHVRVYQRSGRYLLQWWASERGKNVAQALGGDLLEALNRAREIDQKLQAVGGSDLGIVSMPHAELVQRYLADLSRRVEAGALSLATLRRYRSALEHYLEFTNRDDIARQARSVQQVGREFALDFLAFLSSERTAGTMDYDVVRAMYLWAKDPARGQLLPESFVVPFQTRLGGSRKSAGNAFGDAEITVPMLTDFITRCDAYQLRTFACILFFGLRAAEPVMLFREDIDGQWLHCRCIPELEYFTKGRRDKRLPLLPLVEKLIGPKGVGFLLQRRAVAEGRERPPLLGRSREELIQTFRDRCSLAGANSVEQRRQICKRIISDAGGMNYDHLRDEFQAVVLPLNWPREATLKDFRHQFASMLAAAGVPDVYRQYLMGHAGGNRPIDRYTHLGKVREWYKTALQREWISVIAAAERRCHELERINAGVERRCAAQTS